MAVRYRHQAPPNPGASGTAVLYDSFGGTAGFAGNAQYPSTAVHPSTRFRGAIFADQVVNIKQMWAAPGDATLRQIGASVATDGTTVKTFDFPLWPGRNVFQVVTTTAPTVWQVSTETVDGPTTV